MSESLPDERLKVLCVEDEAVIALDLQHAINSSPDMRCVGWLPKADKLAAEVLAKPPDVLLLDLSMPGRDPLEVLSEVLAEHPALLSIVCSGYADKELITKALEAGAKEYVQKNGSVKDILDCVRRVAHRRVPTESGPSQ